MMRKKRQLEDEFRIWIIGVPEIILSNIWVIRVPEKKRENEEDECKHPGPICSVGHTAVSPTVYPLDIVAHFLNIAVEPSQMVALDKCVSC